VLIHSKQKTPDEILDFCRAWPGQVPLVLVPTSYPQLSFGDVAALGKVGLIICVNHAIRAAVAAMRATFGIAARGGSDAGNSILACGSAAVMLWRGIVSQFYPGSIPFAL
jgi:2-methylisocitrate lyase-like PEP mutase family enzyme